jgi:hypothetical protein
MATPRIDIEAFTWDSLQADALVGLHARSVRLYLESVVTPALDTIDARIDELARSEEPAAVFEQGDVDTLMRSTIEAFVLAIQSLWERQFREYLKSCGRELKRDDGYVERLARDEWPSLVKRFGEMRALPLTAFDSFDDLDLLQLLGNACRHGDGKSARRLFDRWPDLWPTWPPAKLGLLNDSPPTSVPSHPPFSQVSIPRTLLNRLGLAVIWFWDDHTYVYTNSLKSKHWSVAETLERMRAARSQRQCRPDKGEASG